MSQPAELGVDSICCLLHNLIPGGSGWQWVRLLERHVESGGRATIVAPPGLLGDRARAAGVEVVPFSWDDLQPGDGRLRPILSGHDAAIVHWDLGVMDALVPALEACGRAALVLHQIPQAPARWLGPEIMPSVRVPIDRAVAAEHAAVLVRGEWHRKRVVAAFDLPGDALSVLPASIPLASIPFHPGLGEPREILVLMRLSPEKAAIAQLAVELTRRRLAAGRPCRLTIAGEGPWREQGVALCERRLPRPSWRIEVAPDDPIARLAASDLVVAQGVTTLEAAALGRRVVVARAIDEDRAAGVVLTPDSYDVAARDPFGEPAVTADAGQLWDQVLSVGDSDLRLLRGLIEEHNSLEAASRALGETLAAIAR
jgi:hypothetical protein